MVEKDEHGWVRKGRAIIPPHVVEKVLDEEERREEELHDNDVKRLIAEDEEEEGIPPYQRCAEIMALRGGQSTAMFHNLVKQGLKEVELKGEEDANGNPAKLRKLNHPVVSSPIKDCSNQEELDRKDVLKQKAYQNQEFIAKAKAWKEKFDALKFDAHAVLGPFDANDKPLFCTDIAAAIKAGKEKKAAERLEKENMAADKVARAKERRKRQERIAKSKPADGPKNEVPASITSQVLPLQKQVSSLEAEKCALVADKSALEAKLGVIEGSLEAVRDYARALETREMDLFKKLCKEEAAKGRLEGELKYLRVMFSMQYPGSGKVSSGGEADETPRGGMFTADQDSGLSSSPTSSKVLRPACMNERRNASSQYLNNRVAQPLGL